MTQEEKQLLIKDLCARLPYHPNIRVFNPDGFEGYQTGEFDTSLWPHHIEPFQMDRFETIKPYLRPMSSITEEENEELKYEIELELQALEGEDGHNTISAAPAAFEIDFYNKHHIDYRGLISKGLALEAPEGMYKTK